MLQIFVMDFRTDFVDWSRNELFGIIVRIDHGD